MMAAANFDTFIPDHTAFLRRRKVVFKNTGFDSHQWTKAKGILRFLLWFLHCSLYQFISLSSDTVVKLNHSLKILFRANPYRTQPTVSTQLSIFICSLFSSLSRTSDLFSAALYWMRSLQNLSSLSFHFAPVLPFLYECQKFDVTSQGSGSLSLLPVSALLAYEPRANTRGPETALS
jgi:hypothetical protein